MAMNATSAGPRPWSRSRWFISILMVFAAQVGLLFALRSRTPMVPPAPAPALSISVATEPAEILALNDPTLFLLPHREGFSGEAWRKTPRLEFQPADWSERPRLLPWTGQPPGGDFAISIRSNAVTAFQAFAIPDPGLEPEYSPEDPLATNSTVRIEGALKERRLVAPFTLRSWPNKDLLTNSVVQVQVDARGDVFSAVLLAPPASPRSDADQLALNLVKKARFEPVQPVGPGRMKSSAPELTTGTIIFQWQSLPLPPTNSPAVGS
jgi:hypothetical protein